MNLPRVCVRLRIYLLIVILKTAHTAGVIRAFVKR